MAATKVYRRMSELLDVTGTSDQGTSPVSDGEATFPLTQVATTADIEAILTRVVWHKVDALTAPWETSNPSVVLTPDGVAFGPYLDGSATGGSVRYHGLDGQPFSVVKNLAYWSRYDSDEKKDEGSALYCRVYTTDASGNQHDTIYTPGSQDYPGLGAGPFEEHVATAGAWRYDSDDGSNSEFGTGVPLGEIQAKYGDQTITKIVLTLGWTAGTNLRALLRWWQINGDHHVFGRAS